MSIRNACFTLNNPTEEEFWEILKLREYNYLIVGYEIGEEELTTYRGILNLHSLKDLIYSKKSLPRVSWRRRSKDACAEQNFDYCSKDGDFYEIGEPNKQGARNDLKKLAAEITVNNLEEVARNNREAYIRYHRGLHALSLSLQEHRNEAPQVHWLWGSTGTGKTRYCVEKHPGNFYIKPEGKWWDGYVQQQAIILDDWYHSTPFRELLTLLDRYKCTREVKGGSVKINSPFIYITSEYAPEYFFQGTELEQLRRRITSVIHLEAEVVR